MIRLTVPAVPVAQPRQRHAIIGGHVRNYTPADHPVNAYKAAVMATAAEAGITPIDGPVAVDVLFYLPRPKRLMRKKDPDGPIPHTAKPDVDNLWKSTADALSGLAWRDDSQVCRTRASKWYAEKDGVPRVEITISEVAQEGGGFCMALEAIALERQTENYTYAEVERMLWRWFVERPQVNLHGKLTHKPRTTGGVQPDRWASVQVNEALLEKIDLYLAYKKLPSHYRRVILFWYGSGWSMDKIVSWYRQNGHPRLHRRTIFKWRRQAVEALVKVLGKKA